MDHATHKLSAYQDSDRFWITFCRVCSREGEFLAEQCPGKYVSSLDGKTVDSKKEQD